MTETARPLREPESVAGQVRYGAGRGLLWAAMAALAYACCYALVVAAGSLPDQAVHQAIGAFMLVTVVAILVALPVGLVAGLILGAVIGLLLAVRPVRSRRRAAVLAALVSLAVTLPIAATIGLSSWAGWVFGLYPALFGAVAAAGLGRDISRRQADTGSTARPGVSPDRLSADG